ncbi:MAG: hypothetical protein DRJ50_13375 [Actinobacteria bacterium]|nr:MAG: hypothetical protein DRJ50_13375 [Actinomycetota bacterium]
MLFGSEPTPVGVCYDRFEDGEDVVIVARHDDSVDISDLVFDVIRKARPGYGELAGSELQPVQVLVSINPSPAEPATSTGPSLARGDALAHVASNSGQSCRVAIFASSTLATGSDHLPFTIAHELFHCIQDQWGGSATDFVEEAGADYFAYELLDRICTNEQTSLGATLDASTTNGSLLDANYEGWFFWAFLSEHRHLGTSQIASLHEGIYAGGDVGSSIVESLSEAPKILNEFYSRLIGPGLACGFKGSSFTSTVKVDKKGPIELDVVNIWRGTRYQLEYDKKLLFEQSSDDPGPIGMVEHDKRSDEGKWVTVAPEVRTTCTEKETWIAVVSPSDPNSSSATPHVLEVDAARPGGCDPCVIGSWSINLGTFAAYMESFSQGADVDIAGSYVLHFAGGPPDEGFEAADERDITMSFPAEGGGLSLHIEGNGSGAYTAHAGRLQTNGYADSGTVTVSGVPVEAGTSFADFGDGGAPFTCEENDLEIHVDGNTVSATRMPSLPKGPPYFS